MTALSIMFPPGIAITIVFFKDGVVHPSAVVVDGVGDVQRRRDVDGHVDPVLYGPTQRAARDCALLRWRVCDRVPSKYVS